jgi:hypothetical protein
MEPKILILEQTMKSWWSNDMNGNPLSKEKPDSADPKPRVVITVFRPISGEAAEAAIH